MSKPPVQNVPLSVFYSGEQAMQQRTGMREHMEQLDHTGSWDTAQQ